MQDITAELEKLIMGDPGRMASLARAAGIERSTLYKFAKGERVPSGEQLYRLTEALGLPPQRAAELMLRGDTLRGSSEPVLRSEVELLLTTLFDAPRRLEKLRALPNLLLPTDPLPLCGLVHGSVNTEQMAGRLAMEYLQGDDVRPVLVSPLCAAPLLSVKAAWELADILNACMALPNLTALLLLWRQVVEGSRRPAEKRNYVN